MEREYGMAQMVQKNTKANGRAGIVMEREKYSNQKVLFSMMGCGIETVIGKIGHKCMIWTARCYTAGNRRMENRMAREFFT
jgi:hypothetical protein